MRHNIRSILLVCILVSVLLFLIGFRLGNKVAKIDSTYVSPTPIIPKATQIPTPTEFPTSIERFEFKNCSLSFLFPPQLEIKQSSEEAQLKKGKESIFVSCNKNTVEKLQKELDKLPQQEVVSMHNQYVNVYNDQKITMWTMRVPSSTKKIAFKVTHDLADLVLKTLEFTRLE